MQEITDEWLIGRLKGLISSRGVKLTDLAAGIGVPYRTLQNQFSGQSKMPATTLLKAASFLKVPLYQLSPEGHPFDLVAMSMALDLLLGDFSPSVTDGGSKILQLVPPKEGQVLTRDERRTNCNWLAILLEKAYANEVAENARVVASRQGQNVPQ